jgi:hypothetical protein
MEKLEIIAESLSTELAGVIVMDSWGDIYKTKDFDACNNPFKYNEKFRYTLLDMPMGKLEPWIFFEYK